MPTKKNVPLFDFRELCGLAKRASPHRDEQARVRRWAELLLQGALKTVGAQLDAPLELRLTQLAARRPNFTDVIEWLFSELSFGTVIGEGLAFSRLLLVGPAGSGKTTFSLELAAALGLPLDVVPMNNLQTGSFLSGSERHWSNSEPGALFRLLASSPVLNPMMVLDEIDKVRGHSGYDPLNALFTLLERKTAERFTDAAIPDIHLNAGMVNWIATANDIDSLSAPLKSRFNVFHIRALFQHELIALVQHMYVALVASQPALASRLDAHLHDAAVESLVGAMQSGRDVDRTLRMLVGRALRAGERSVSVDSLPPVEQSGRGNAKIGFF